MEDYLETLGEEPRVAWLSRQVIRQGSKDEDGEEWIWEALSEAEEVAGERLRNRALPSPPRVAGKRLAARRAAGDAAPERAQKDAVGLYLTEVRRYKLMTAEEEIRMTRDAQAGDQSARDAIVTRNLRLVISIAKRYQGLGLPLADLIEEGNLGLMKSVDRFDWKRGLRFSTYSSKWIRQSITRALVNTSRTVRIPSNVLTLLKKIALVQRSFHQKRGRAATYGEICKRLRISMIRLAEVYGLTQTLLSLDLPIDPDGGRRRLHDLLPATETKNPADSALQGLEGRHVARLLDQLSAREQKILRLRFGFDGDEPRSLEETGVVLGVTRERIRQLEGRALTKLRRLVLTSSDEGSEIEDASSNRPRLPIERKTPKKEGSTSCGSSRYFPRTSDLRSSSVVSAA